MDRSKRPVGVEAMTAQDRPGAGVRQGERDGALRRPVRLPRIASEWVAGDAGVTLGVHPLPVSKTLWYIARMSPLALLTAEELERLNLPNKRTELVRGQLVVREPAGFTHGDVAMRLAALLFNFVEANALGRVYAAETGFTLFRGPDTVRAPDAAYIRKERIPDPPPRGFAELPPDLVIEVLSPDDRAGEIRDKVDDWLQAGCRLVWIVDPERRRGRVYRPDGSEVALAEGDAFDGEDVLPGFSLPLTDVLR
jgi:Uma2 family endonuclease